ncbi:MAG: hypothetical protein M1834_001457 [Cirrosporium novae-zelandiae]|nr:MAG: hypothetical protein M1834_001457 [Cirrosporium novae-zelandiae]
MSALHSRRHPLDEAPTIFIRQTKPLTATGIPIRTPRIVQISHKSSMSELPAMHRQFRPDGLELAIGQLSRSTSMSSDRPSLSGLASLASPPASIQPDPRFIASTSASGIIAGLDEEDNEYAMESNEGRNSADAIDVTEGCISLVNLFLDQLLYKFLATSRSTSLASLRSAVSEVLKPRIAREAIMGADEELKQYLGGGEDEELSEFHGGQEPTGDWDLDLIWKRTRLRCMVYTRHGDFEEDDEEMYLEEENRDDAPVGSRRCSIQKSVSPAVAIFLTSILEFIGENCLLIAGEAARIRVMRSRNLVDSQTPTTDDPQPLIVDECDMEKVAFDTAMGRLWRSWRKRFRSPSHSSHSLHRPVASESGYRRGNRLGSYSLSQKSSASNMDDFFASSGVLRKTSTVGSFQSDDPAFIPLPTSENDVEEIEGTPSEKDTSTEGSDETTKPCMRKRPSSMIILPRRSEDDTLQISSVLQAPGAQGSSASMPPFGRTRSRSLPASPFPELVPDTDDDTAELVFETPLETPNPIDGIENEKPAQDSPEQKVTETVGLSAKSKSTSGEEVLTGVSGTVSPVPEEAENIPGESTEADSIGHKSIDGSDIPTPVSQPQPEVGNNKSASIPGSVNKTKTPIENRAKDRDAPRTVQSRQEPYQKSTTSRDSSKEVQEPPREFPKRVASRTQEAITQAERAKIQEQLLLASSPAAYKRGATSNSHQPQTGSHVSPSPRPSAPRSGVPVHENNAPPLTPLREMTEAVHGTSDKAPSTTHSYDARQESSSSAERMPSEHISRSESSSIYSHHKQSSVGASTKSRYHVPVAQPSSSEQTASPASASPAPRQREFSLTRSASKNRSNSTDRELHSVRSSSRTASPSSHKASASLSSQTTNGYRRPLPPRTSSDGSISANGRKGSFATTIDEKKQSFEQLINSDETIRYDLTSQRMREMEDDDGPRVVLKRTGTSEMADFLKTTGPTSDEKPRPPTSKSLASSLKGLRSHSVNDASKSGQSTPKTSVDNPVPVLNPAGSKTPSARPRVGTGARDARVDAQSTRDFADFIRSTGPDRFSAVQPLKRSNTTARPIAVVNNTTPRETTSSSGPRANEARSATSRPKTSGSRLQARAPTLPKDDQTSDLIDFIRQGPPRDHNDGTHRIPRNVAPFRNTMDSDELQTLTEKPNELPRSSATSSNPTLQSSTNSRTGLLDSATHPSLTHFGSGALDTTFAKTPEPPAPVRKQRRVKDPYSLPSDDEDEDEELLAPKKPRRQEESLMDFLNSVPPPPEPHAPTPFVFANTKASTQKTSKHVQRKASASALMSRFNLGGSSHNHRHQGSTNTRNGTNSPRKGVSGPPQLALPRTASPLPPLGFDKYNSTSHDGPLTSQPVRRINPGQARGAQVSNERSDLADYLRNTTPPPSVAEIYASHTPPKDENGFRKMFSRRK